MPPKADPILCYVTDRRALGADPAAWAELSARIGAAAAAGVDWIQLREKDLRGGALLRLAQEAVATAAGSARVLVNDRLDVAVAAGAGGVHLGGESLPVAEVKQWVAARYGLAPAAGIPSQGLAAPFLVGASCHSLEDAEAAARDGADYIFFGPVFVTPAKARFGPPQGIGKLAEVCRRVSLPVLAIGGVTEENAAACLEAGAAGIAAIRLFQQSPGLPALVARLRG